MGETDEIKLTDLRIIILLEVPQFWDSFFQISRKLRFFRRIAPPANQRYPVWYLIT